MSCDRLIFNMEIPIPGKDVFNIEMEPWYILIPILAECKLQDSDNIHILLLFTFYVSLPNMHLALFDSM